MEHTKKAIAGFQFVLCLCLAIVSPRAFARGINSDLRENDQERSQTSATTIAAGIGLSDFHQRDKYLSPFTFGGTSFASRLSFQTNTEKNEQRVDAFFTKGSINSDQQPRDVTQYVGHLSYSFLHSMYASQFEGRPLRFLVGGGISSFVTDTDLFATDEYGNKTYDQSWYWSHSLSLVLAGEYRIGEEEGLAVRITSPIVALVTRPENGHWLSLNNLDVSRNFLRAATHGQIEYVWNNVVFQTDVEYRQSVGEHFGVLAAYKFSYVSSDRPADMLSLGMYSNSLLAGVEWVW